MNLQMSVVRVIGDQIVTGHMSRDGRFVDIRPVTIRPTCWGQDGRVRISITPSKGVSIDPATAGGRDHTLMPIAVETVVEGDWVIATQVTIELDGQQIVIPCHVITGPTDEVRQAQKTAAAELDKRRGEIIASVESRIIDWAQGNCPTDWTGRERRLLARWCRLLITKGHAQDEVVRMMQAKLGADWTIWAAQGHSTSRLKEIIRNARGGI